MELNKKNVYCRLVNNTFIRHLKPEWKERHFAILSPALHTSYVGFDGTLICLNLTHFNFFIASFYLSIKCVIWLFSSKNWYVQIRFLFQSLLPVSRYCLLVWSSPSLQFQTTTFLFLLFRSDFFIGIFKFWSLGIFYTI